MKKAREYGTGSVSQRKDGYWVGRITAGKKPDGKPDVKVVYGKKGVQQKTVVFNPASGVTVPSKKQFTQKDIPFYTEAEAKILTKQAMSYWGNGKRRYPLGSP